MHLIFRGVFIAIVVLMIALLGFLSFLASLEPQPNQTHVIEKISISDYQAPPEHAGEKVISDSIRIAEQKTQQENAEEEIVSENTENLAIASTENPEEESQTTEAAIDENIIDIEDVLSATAIGNEAEEEIEAEEENSVEEANIEEENIDENLDEAESSEALIETPAETTETAEASTAIYAYPNAMEAASNEETSDVNEITPLAEVEDAANLPEALEVNRAENPADISEGLASILEDEEDNTDSLEPSEETTPSE